MKKGVVLAAAFLAFAVCAPVVAQPNARAVETIFIDKFDEPGSYGYDWGIQGSRFSTNDEENGIHYPLMNYFEGMPLSLKPYHKPSDPTAQVLGVKTKYDRKGENWLEIFPTIGGERTEIECLGTVTQFDLWVWGAGYLYYLEILVRDAEGRTHIIPCGNLQFNGWRNLVVNVPTYIRQHSRFRSGPKNLSFLGLRVRSDVNEFVDDYVVYFDQIKYVTNTLANVYDGYELREADFGDKKTSSSTSSSGQAAEK